MNYLKERKLNKKEKLLIEYLLSTPEAYIIAKPVLKPDYFEKELSGVVGYINLYNERYKELPSQDQVEAETGIVLNQQTDGRVKLKWLLDEVEQHCKQQAVVKAVMESTEYITNGEYSSIIDPIKEAVHLSLHRDLGRNYFDNPKERLKEMLQLDLQPTGFSLIDEALFGGTMPGGLNIAAANSGVGKSWFLLNLGKNYIDRGKNVAYISLELSELFICKRMDQMVAEMPAQEIMKYMDEVDAKVRQYSKGKGTMMVKYFPSQTKVHTIESYLKEAELKLGIKFDLILVDYLDLLIPNNDRVDINDAFTRDKYSAEDLRSIMMEANYQCWTASQLNRDAIKEANDGKEHDQSHIAGGISKINTADTIITLTTSQSLEEMGVIKITFLKTRTSSGVGKIVPIGVDPVIRIMYDADESIVEKFYKKDQKKSSNKQKEIRNPKYNDRDKTTNTLQRGKDTLTGMRNDT